MTALTMDHRIAASARMQKKRLFAFSIPTLVLAYLAYIFVSFDVAGLYHLADIDNARARVADR